MALVVRAETVEVHRLGHMQQLSVVAEAPEAVETVEAAEAPEAAVAPQAASEAAEAVVTAAEVAVAVAGVVVTKLEFLCRVDLAVTALAPLPPPPVLLPLEAAEAAVETTAP